MRKNILISVSYKKGIEKFENLDKKRWRIIASTGVIESLKGGTQPFISVEKFTGYPRIIDGKTEVFHPKIMGGILDSNGKTCHLEDLRLQLIEPIAVCIVDVPVFKEKSNTKVFNSSNLALISFILENHKNTVCVVDYEDYDLVIEELNSNGEINKINKEYLFTKAIEQLVNYYTGFFSHVITCHNEKNTFFT